MSRRGATDFRTQTLTPLALPCVPRCGKLVLARSEVEITQYDVLLARAAANGAPLERVSPKEVLELEPLARSEFGGLWSPSTATADPVQVTRSLLQDAVREGVILRPDSHVQRLVPDGDGVRVCLHSGESAAAAHVVNCAGLHADTFAHQLGFGRRYSILPFKGLYMQCVGLPLRRLVYPVPQLRGDGGHAPFLGVHFTVTAAGGVKIGPTAIPALWREQYAGLQGFNLQEMLGVLATQLRLALGSDFNFRRLAAQEVMKYIPSVMQAGARDLVPSAGPQHFGAFSRAGIRAQLVDTERGSLEMDFIVEGGTSSTHILNAVSPGWTCSQPFAEMVVQDHVLPALRRSSSTAVA